MTIAPTLAPLLDAPVIIQIHVTAALSAVVLGPMALWRRSRDRWHKRLGYGWVTAMSVTILSSFGISSMAVIGPFGPIHALSVFAAWGIWQGVSAARKGRIAEHQEAMRQIYFWALGITGLLTFLPGRMMSDIVFPQNPDTGFAIAACLILGALAWRWQRSAHAHNG